LHISGKFYLENLVLVGVSTHVPSSTHLTNLIVLGQALSMDAIVNVVSNNITAEATLNDLHLALKWSDIGNFPVNLLQVSWVSYFSI
jgi:hypothetical protein